jgi:site-specific DNA recombinase
MWPTCPLSPEVASLATLKWAGYRRVSRVGDRGERLISPQLQEQRILGYAQARGLDVELLEPELDVSGARVKRPILEAAIIRIEQGELAGLIVSQIDRLSRMRLGDALAVLERIESAGGQVIAVAENIDATTPEGRFARNLFLSLAGMQRDRNRAEIMRSRRQAVERGIWPTNTPPIGYRKGAERRLEPTDEAQMVRDAFEARAAGRPWSAVAEILGRGLSGARKVVTNRAYLGELRLEVDGDVVVNRTAHEPLVGRELFEAAQLDHPRPPRGTRGSGLLTGLIRCAGCGCRMTLDAANYRCRPRKAGWTCSAPAMIARRVVEPYIERGLLAHAADLGFAAEAATDARRDVEGQLQAAETELEAYQEAVSVSELGPETFARGMRTRQEAVEEARLALGELAGGPMPILTGELGAIWSDLSIEERRHVLSSAFGVVWVRRGRGAVSERVRIVVRGAEPTGLPAPGFRRSEPFVLDWDSDLDGEIRVPAPQDLGEAPGGTPA